MLPCQRCCRFWHSFKTWEHHSLWTASCTESSSWCQTHLYFCGVTEAWTDMSTYNFWRCWKCVDVLTLWSGLPGRWTGHRPHNVRSKVPIRWADRNCRNHTILAWCWLAVSLCSYIWISCTMNLKFWGWRKVFVVSLIWHLVWSPQGSFGRNFSELWVMWWRPCNSLIPHLWWWRTQGKWHKRNTELWPYS